jgi:hypothetical protein
MIDRMMRRAPGKGRCELCEREVATRRAKFKAQYVETTASPLMDEESLSSIEVEKRVCEGCLESLKKSTNVSDLTFERL